MVAPYVHDTVGTVVPLSKERVITIGREGDLAFPDNAHLHRRLVAVFWSDHAWWIKNVGTWIPVRYAPRGVTVSSLLEVGQAERLSAEQTHIVFRAGKTEYEAVVVIPDFGPSDGIELPPAVGTTTAGPEELTDEQIMMLAAFCEEILRYPGTGLDRIATMKEVEDRLSWSTAKLRRKLDYLCQKLDAAGISGLVAEDGTATARRLVLCEWALTTRTVKPAHLRLLP